MSKGLVGASAQGKVPRDEGTEAGFGGQLVLDLGAEAGLELGFSI